MQSLWSWLMWANSKHVKKDGSEDAREQGRSKDSVTMTLMQYQWSTNLIWSSLMCTNLIWMGKFALYSYCVFTVSILRQLHNHHDRFTFLQRQRYVQTRLYKTTLRSFYVHSVLNMSVVHLY